MIQRFKTTQKCIEICEQICKDFGQSSNFHDRQAFVYMCWSLVNLEPDIFRMMKDCFLSLTVDRVPNVRLLVAETLAIILSNSTPLYFDKEINLACLMMKKDKD